MNDDDYIKRTPGQQTIVDSAARKIFGRTPTTGQCVRCGSSKMGPEDFQDRLSLRESRISYQCQSCQDETYEALRKLEEGL